jgi:hemoglobin-like flavoprotein
MNKITITTSVIKAGVAIIPWAGGPLSSIIGDISQERYNKRWQECIDKINSNLMDRIETIDKEKVSQEDFKDIFVNILNDVLKNRTREKRMALINILINTIANYNISFDESEYTSNLVNRLTVKHLLILNEVDRVPILPQKEVETAVNIISTIVEKYSLEEHDILEIIHDLENEYLIFGFSTNYMRKEPLSGGLIYVDFESYTTDKGKRVLNVITNISD